MRFVALLDACVLYPAPLRDFLLRLATTQLFAAKWTEQIHDEWIRNLLANRPELKDQLDRTRRLMNQAIHPDVFVEQQFDLYQGAVISAVKRHRAALKNPPKSAPDYLETLAAQGLVVTAERLREFSDLI